MGLTSSPVDADWLPLWDALWLVQSDGKHYKQDVLVWLYLFFGMLINTWIWQHVLINGDIKCKFSFLQIDRQRIASSICFWILRSLRYSPPIIYHRSLSGAGIVVRCQLLSDAFAMLEWLTHVAATNCASMISKCEPPADLLMPLRVCVSVRRQHRQYLNSFSCV